MIAVTPPTVTPGRLSTSASGLRTSAPFAALVIRSGFIPKVFGVLLAVSGCAYVTECVALLFAPQHRGLIGNILTLPLAAGELSTLVWLLAKGVREPAPLVAATPRAA